MIRRPVVALTALTLIAAPTAAFAGASGTAASATKQVPGVLAGLSRAVLDGPAPAGRVMSIGIGLNRPDPAGEDALIAAQNNPKSATYHHFLTPAQFDARFGVAPATVTATTTWLGADGVHVTSVSPSRDYLTATGTVSQLDRRLGISIGRYHDAKDGTFIANDVAPRVPTSLPVDGILGLNTVQKATPSVMHPSRASGSARSTKADSSFSGVLTPQNLWKIYNEPSSDEGQGQTIGIFGEGETDSVITQLRLFEHHEHFPKIPVKVIHTEGGKNSAYGDNTGSIEWYLDVQASTGMAPKAKQLDLYFAKTLFDKDIAKSFSTWVNDKQGPKQMNASFGECETSPTNPVTGPAAQLPYGTELGDELEPVAEPMLKMAVAEGRTLFASAGDTGSGCPEVVVPVAGAGNGVAPQPLPIANYPSASAWAVGVGGTVITTPGSNHNKRASEEAWQDTGGGPSHFILEPQFQKKTSYITASNAPCLTDRSGTPYPVGSICRGTPDVAALSGNILGNGYFIYIDGEPSSEGGTSLSSPLTMGMWARLQAAAKSKAGLGFADETFYRQADKSAKTYQRDFTDITATDSKAEGGVSTTNGGYTAEKGYDFVSGLGALNVGHLLTDVDKTQHARYHRTKPEKPGLVESTVTMASPAGNAVNPLDVQAGNLPAIDITKVAVSTSKAAAALTAVFRGPAISATPDAASGSAGEDFYAYWRYKSKVYYAVAHTSPSGTPTYASGRITKNGYVDNTASKATGSFVGHKLVITLPLSEVGTPARGALLINPAAITQLNAGGVAGVTSLLALTADSASYPSLGKASAGDAVCVGRCKAHLG